MSNLSEELVTLKEIKYALDNIGAFDFGDFQVETIRSILDLYNKEKEKNKELQEMLKHRIKYTNELEEDLFQKANNYVISKDKIREKLKEIIEIRNKEFDTIGISMRGSAIDVLKELLEEE